jgi:hypothetical protein
VLLIEIQINAAGLKALDRAEQIDERTAKAVDGPRHDNIEFAPACVQARPSVSALGAADASVPVDLHDFPAAALGNLAKLADLILDGLRICADSHVKRGLLHLLCHWNP